MTKIHRQLFLTTTFLVIATLAACGRPTLRTKSLSEPPATSASPAQAEKENRDAAAAAAVDKAAAEMAKDLGAERSSKDSEIAAAEAEARRFARVAALDQVAKLFAEGAPQVAPTEKAAPTETETQTDAQKADQEKQAAVALEVYDTMTVPAPTSMASVQFEAAVKRAFVLSLIEPTMRLNNAVALQREEVLRLKKKLDAKQEVSKFEHEWLEKIKMDYGLVDSKATIEQLLERVDAVTVSFLAAPLALKTGWGTLGGVPRDLLSKRIEELNTSLGESKIRFRSARTALAAQPKVGGGAELMRAFLGVSGEPETLAHKVLIDTTLEISGLLAEPESVQEIERVRSDLVRENTPAYLRN